MREDIYKQLLKQPSRAAMLLCISYWWCSAQVWIQWALDTHNVVRKVNLEAKSSISSVRKHHSFSELFTGPPPALTARAGRAAQLRTRGVGSAGPGLLAWLEPTVDIFIGSVKIGLDNQNNYKSRDSVIWFIPLFYSLYFFILTRLSRHCFYFETNCCDAIAGEIPSLDVFV